MSVAVIGGSGFADWPEMSSPEWIDVDTPYDPDPVRICRGEIAGVELVFMARHGSGHSIPPHLINYRANIWALKKTGVKAVVSIATVGGIAKRAITGALMVPDQILDYTYGREHTFFDGRDGVVGHIDMTSPYCEELRQQLLAAAAALDTPVLDTGTYAATQGPRFETPAEIIRLHRDGADIVGMTGMPETSLARELQLAYAAIAVIVNPAAGLVTDGISGEEVRHHMAAGRKTAEALLLQALPAIDQNAFSIPPPVRP